MKIVLLKAGTEVGTIASSVSTGSGGTGSYTWPISTTGTTGSDYKVSVQSISQPTIKDTSTNYFTLTSATTTPYDHRHLTEWRGDVETRHFSYSHLELHGQSRVDGEDCSVEGRY